MTDLVYEERKKSTGLAIVCLGNLESVNEI